MITTKQTKIVLLFAFAIGGLGCADDGFAAPDQPFQPPPDPATLEEFVGALPTDALLTLLGPGDEAQDGQVSGALVGEVSEYYRITKTTTAAVNKGLKHILEPIRWLVNNRQPTSLDRNTAVWFARDGVAQRDFLLVMRRQTGYFDFTLVSRTLGADDWSVLLFGNFTPGAEPGRGQGAVLVNLDGDGDDNSVGKVLALWSNVGDERTVTAYFYEASGDLQDHGPRNEVYHYMRERTGAGVFVYHIAGLDIDKPGSGKDALENVAIISRWDETGAGRADFYAADGDVAAQGLDVAVISQCWAPQSFSVVYETTWIKPTDGEATQWSKDGVRQECAYLERAEAVLPDPTSAPLDPAIPPEADTF